MGEELKVKKNIQIFEKWCCHIYSVMQALSKCKTTSRVLYRRSEPQSSLVSDKVFMEPHISHISVICCTDHVVI